MVNHSVQPLYIGLFKDRASVENAYNAICSRGYNSDSINIIMSVETRDKKFSSEFIGKNRISKPTGLGFLLSAVYELTDVVNAGLVMPKHSIVVAGPISAGLAGAGAGGFSRGVIESLLGIPEVYASKFESGIKHGWIVMSLKPRNEDDAGYVEWILKENNVEELYKK